MSWRSSWVLPCILSRVLAIRPRPRRSVSRVRVRVATRMRMMKMGMKKLKRRLWRGLLQFRSSRGRRLLPLVLPRGPRWPGARTRIQTPIRQRALLGPKLARVQVWGVIRDQEVRLSLQRRHRRHHLGLRQSNRFLRRLDHHSINRP